MTKNITLYQKALELKKQGYTYEQIAPMLGYKAKSSVTKLLARGYSVKRAKNSFFPAPDGTGGISKDPSQQWGANNPKNLNTFIAPLQFARIKQDILYWRSAILETELAYFPHRVKMQRVYIDTILDPQVWACISKRKELTLLKKFGIYDTDGNEVEELTGLFKNKEWFQQYVSYMLDSIYFGYTLIGLGDVVNNEFPNLTVIRRHLVSPERLNLVPFEYMLEGVSFLEEPYSDWSCYISTPSEIGVTKCGYGLLYKCAPYAIYNRNLLGYNNDFVEKYAMPTFWLKSAKTSDDERNELEQAARFLASNSYLVTDPGDEVQFLESKFAGNGYQGYDNLEMRNEKKISKLILGHADAIDSKPGHLGATGEKSDAEKAMDKKEIYDNTLAENNINNMLIPKLIKLGFPIPAGYTFKYKNDQEQQDIEAYENTTNTTVSTIVLALKQAGFDVDPAYITERTGIPVKRSGMEG
jgi:hypothetical protein